MPRIVHEPLVKKNLLLNPRKLRALRKLVGAKTESEAVRLAVGEAVAHRRVVQSLDASLDALKAELKRR